MQRKIRAVIMRGGTSRAVFFRDEDLPADPELRARIIMYVFGSPDPYRRQLNGLGGATSSTSKVAIISPGRDPGIDVNYTFGQVTIDRPLIDGRGNCGNISSAVGPYAVDEGLVAATDPETVVRFVNTNTSKVIVAHVPTQDGEFNHEGDYAINGVPGTGSRIVLDYLDPGGAVTGKLLPTGSARDVLDIEGVGQIEVSIVDAANPLVFCRFEDLGLTGQELPAEIDANPALLARIEAVRATAGVKIGLAESLEDATASAPSVPKLALVTASASYPKIDGHIADASHVDLVAKIMSMGRVHSAYALTGAICTTVAAAVPGTIVRDAVSSQSRETGLVRLGHPSGTLELSAAAEKRDGEWYVEKVSASRTARRIMEGFVYVPESVRRGTESALAAPALEPAAV